ncbi:DUF4376 domain-containing protein [Burkholderia cepacia]|uniref:DUF4376 domain-containing protein n=1 Tax=Burkholderia cepacia TaxID=292 RepID=UPI002ABD36C6|nr:hypothetical protein [Burkholderia cepacia]
MRQKFAAYDSTGKITAFYDSIDSPVPANVENVIELTDTEWQACISTPGYTVEAGVLVAPPVPTAAQQLADAQSSQIALINAACQAQIVAGFTSSALGAPHTYPSQLTDQQNLSASVLASVMPNLPSDWTTPFWCADATENWAYVAHTAAQIQQVGQDGKSAILSAIETKATLAAEISAARTISAVQAITWP